MKESNEKLISVPEDLFWKLTTEYMSKINHFKEAYKGYYDSIGSRWNRNYNDYVDEYNRTAKLLGWETKIE